MLVVKILNYKNNQYGRRGITEANTAKVSKPVPISFVNRIIKPVKEFAKNCNININNYDFNRLVTYCTSPEEIMYESTSTGFERYFNNAWPRDTWTPMCAWSYNSWIIEIPNKNNNPYINSISNGEFLIVIYQSDFGVALLQSRILYYNNSQFKNKIIHHQKGIFAIDNNYNIVEVRANIPDYIKTSEFKHKKFDYHKARKRAYEREAMIARAKYGKS